MGRSRCTLRVEGMDCPAEVPPLRAALERHPGVSDLGFDPIHGLMTVDYDPDRVDVPALVLAIAKSAGMKAESVDQDGSIEPKRAFFARWGPTLGYEFC